jgi:hypothetical protein
LKDQALFSGPSELFPSDLLCCAAILQFWTALALLRALHIFRGRAPTLFHTSTSFTVLFPTYAHPARRIQGQCDNVRRCARNCQPSSRCTRHHREQPASWNITNQRSIARQRERSYPRLRVLRADTNIPSKNYCANRDNDSERRVAKRHPSRRLTESLRETSTSQPERYHRFGLFGRGGSCRGCTAAT